LFVTLHDVTLPFEPQPLTPPESCGVDELVPTPPKNSTRRLVQRHIDGRCQPRPHGSQSRVLMFVDTQPPAASCRKMLIVGVE